MGCVVLNLITTPCKSYEICATMIIIRIHMGLWGRLSRYLTHQLIPWKTGIVGDTVCVDRLQVT